MGGGDSAPQAYTPANQAGADRSYYRTLNGLTQQDQATAAFSNAGYNAAYSGVVNNPYDASMLAGINTAAGTTAGVAGADLASGAAATGAAGQGYADANTARGLAAPMTADADTLRAYAPFLAQLGFDPQMANFNYGMKQTQDQQNVVNAEQGIAGSPFAAGATGDAMAAYKRNYDASRSTQAMQALAALSSLYSGASGLDANAIAALSSAGDMDTKAAGLATTGSGLSHSGAEAQILAAQLPYTASNQIQTDRLAALDEMVNGQATTGANLRGDVQGYGGYLNIGQNATALDQNAAKINAQNSFLGQLGQLAGIAVQVGAHFIPGYG
jgi:hypothetical protein